MSNDAGDRLTMQQWMDRYNKNYDWDASRKKINKMILDIVHEEQRKYAASDEFQDDLDDSDILQTIATAASSKD
jgi:hypothetical protein